MVKPQAISTENLAGLEGNLEDFSKQTEIIVPKNSLVYQNTLGETSIRFIDYQENEEDQEELTETMIKYIILEGKYYPIKIKFYQADGLIADDDELLVMMLFQPELGWSVLDDELKSHLFLVHFSV